MWMLTEYFMVLFLLQLGHVNLEPLATDILKKSFIVETNDELYAAYLSKIIEALSSSSSNDAGQYVLQPFSESDVPIPIISNSLAEMQESIVSLLVEDSQNCSAHGLNSLALYSGLNSSASNSLVVVLSGTSAKPDGTFIPEILDLVQKKQLRVIFLVSDECTEDDIDDGLRLMEQITEVSSGVIFSLDTLNISQVIRFIQTFEYGEDASLISPTLSSPGVSSYALIVDDSVEQLLVILTGLEPIISIADVEGEKLEEERDFEYIVDSNKLQIIFLENIIPGEYAVSVFSSSDSLVQVIGFAPSPIDVRYRFYYEKTVDMTEATERPYTVQGSYNFMLMQIENTETNEWYAHEMIQEVEFVSLVGEVLPKYSFSMGSSNFVTQEGADNAHYVLQMQPPEDHFYIRIRGVTKNQPFQRSSKVAYSQWRPVPTQPSSFIVFEFENCDYEAIWYEPKHIFTKSLIGYQFSFGAEADAAIDFQLPSNVTSYRVKQLAKGLTYVFTVAAINEAGVGEAISVTVVTPTDKPRAPPTNIRLIQTTESLIEIAWQPPMAESRGGNIIGYTTIHYRMSDPWKRYRFNTSKNHVVFKKLRPNTEYGFQIAAQTIIGQGPYSQAVVFKTQFLAIPSNVSPTQTQTTIQPHIDTDEPNVGIDSALHGPSEVKSVDQQNEQKSLNIDPNEQTQNGQLNVTTDKPKIDKIDTELKATVIPVKGVTIMDDVHSSLELGSPTPSKEKAVSNTTPSESELNTKVEAQTDNPTVSPVSVARGNNSDGDITRNDISDVKTDTQRSGNKIVRGDVGEYDGSSYTNNSLSRIIAYPVNDQGETESNHGENGGSFITLEKKLADLTQPVGGRAVFLCRIKGSPTVNYSWYLDNEIIDVQTFKNIREKMIPHRGMRLTIRDLTLIDQGVYTCRGENEFGKIETSAVLNVRSGLTGIVTDLQAPIVSSNAVTIKWFPPLLHPSDGPLVNYVVYIYKLSLPSEIYKFETNVTELVYENLEANTEYVFRVRAVTSKGKGPYSSLPVKTTAEGRLKSYAFKMRRARLRQAMNRNLNQSRLLHEIL
ncbi:receptor-type tyrosine-protein phosphatase F-like [Anneissia japonica]|uniref:receptor-type tyrosine-protein phosphatase F-like n=1 Tax=Anneissia japonica TaxID=1529436 RepID=UPI001425869B|nr:receptor-type tyrosine-protein phosphatase F-like [Anneissia japonica]